MTCVRDWIVIGIAQGNGPSSNCNQYASPISSANTTAICLPSFLHYIYVLFQGKLLVENSISPRNSHALTRKESKSKGDKAEIRQFRVGKLFTFLEVWGTV
ncbi:hypothetical protein EUGRSUZ_B01736 [Eucalyptus grandis]|uniref:Uncharacterized protein n=2 Tax=Eucalyptus grandis TaxID=71139 RepID=A0ACC3LSB3_EUCGR|nr:hypothetical protein EUGRSUZ_B01736 [Eucalyptus grandis]